MCWEATLLAVCIRILGVTILDMSIDTDSPSHEPEPEQVQGDLSGRVVGFEYRTDTLPGVSEETT